MSSLTPNAVPPLPLLAAALLGAAGFAQPATAAYAVQDQARIHVLLIGASIGAEWNFPGLPGRMELANARCEYQGLKGFDKSTVLRSALSRSVDRPDVVILKECSSYFPGDPRAYHRLVEGWVKDCRDAGVIPVLATVVPVVDRSDQKPLSVRLKIFAKRLFGRPTRASEIARYNDWIRDYARSEGLLVLDLEAALRVSDSDRELRRDLASGDGLHLKPQAYENLDRIGADLLRQLTNRPG